MTKEVEQPKQLVLADLGIDALKSLAYDQILLLQQTQNNINLLQAEINKRK